MFFYTVYEFFCAEIYCHSRLKLIRVLPKTWQASKYPEVFYHGHRFQSFE